LKKHQISHLLYFLFEDFIMLFVYFIFCGLIRIFNLYYSSLEIEGLSQEI